MKCETIKHALLGESYQKYTMDNGLTVLVYPMPQKNGVYALLGAKIGSTTGDFALDGRAVHVPAGVAHFLEHKMFEGEDGDAFELFAKTGASANAYTSFDKTCYLFSSSVNIEESLRTLIRFVGSPHFTEQTVDKEQGIIGQEIKMYDDNPEWALAMLSLQSLYSVSPLKEDIAGTVESIAQITPALLYDCYNAFYRPENMALAVAGNIAFEQVKAICDEEYSKIKVPAERVERLANPEPQAIVTPYVERRMSVFAPQFCLGYKETPHEPALRRRRELACRMLLELIAGETSDLYRRLYDEGLLNDMFDASPLDARDYLCITFSGETAEPRRVADMIKQEIARFKAEGIDEARFTECQRAFLGSALCGFDSVESTCTKMLYALFKDSGLYDIIKEIQDITRADVEALLADLFDETRSSLAVILPLEEQE